MSLDQILMIPGYSADGGSSATFSLTANNLVAGTPVLGTPALTLISGEFPDPSSYYAPTLAASSYTASYSAVRPVDAGTSDVMLCRRASDNGELAFGGLYDPATRSALETWSQGQDVFVKTLYEQSGSGATDATQTTAGLQPKIVSAGSVIMDEDTGTIPMLDFSGGKYLVGTAASTIAQNDFSLMEILRHPNAESGEFRVFTIKNQNNSYIGILPHSDRMAFPGNSRLTDGNGDDWIRLSPYNWFPTIRTFTYNATEVLSYRNNVKSYRGLETIAAGTETEFYIGQAPTDTGDTDHFACEWFLTDALSDADQQTLYNSVNGFYSLGPTTTHEIPGYQYERWSETMWDHIGSVTEPDVMINLAAETWDGTYANTEALADLWVEIDEFPNQFALRSDPKWFIEEAADGRGFRPSRTKHIQHINYGPNNGNAANGLTAIWKLNLPLTGGGQGNPFYQDSGVANRAIVMACLNLLGHDYEQSIDPTYSSHADFCGGAGYGSIGTYYELKSLMSTSLQDAFYAAGKWWLRKIRQIGARHENANMDCKAIPFCTVMWKDADARGDTATKTLALETARQVLFGSTTGTPETSVWDLRVSDKAGIYATSGHVVEGGSPETTYNGQSFKEIALGWSYVQSDSEWDFLKTMLAAYTDWQELQTFDDITDITGTFGAFQGPSGYSGRTTGPVARDQGGSKSRYTTTVAADPTSLWNLRYREPLEDAAAMVSTIQSDISSTLGDVNTAVVAEHTAASACHTNGKDWSNAEFTVDTTTHELVMSGSATISLSVNDPVLPLTNFGEAPRAVLNAGAGSSTNFDSSQFWYVTAVSGSRVSVSDTLGGTKINFTTGGVAPSYSPHHLVPIYHLTDSPDTSAWDGNTSKHLLVNGEFGRIVEIDNTNDIVAAQTSGAAIASGSPVNYEVWAGPRHYQWAGNHWPPLFSRAPDGDWHTSMKALLDANDANSFLRTATAGATYNISLDDEWWAFRNTTGSREFAWFVSASDYGGTYNGHHPNVLEAFWAEDFGVAILSRRFDLQSSDKDWSNIANWVTQHVWGLDDKGTPTAFSTARGDEPDSVSTFSLGASPPNVTSTRRLGDGEPNGLENNDEITGYLDTAYYRGLAPTGDGIRETVTLTSDQADSATQLWYSIPINLRDTTQAIADTTIQYWNGSTWVALSTTLVNTQYIRLGRNHGSGDVYVWLAFTAAVDVKLSPVVKVQTYQGEVRSRMIQVNMHANTTESAALLPASKAITYDVRVTEPPGLTPTDPALAFNAPATSTTLLTNGLWWAEGTCTFYGTGGSVDLEYSTDSTDGSDGTWTTVATMANVSGDIYRYVGDDVAIPTGLTYIRMNASDSSGSSTLARAVSSSATAIVLDDPFTGADATVMDGVWSGWSTNSTGNSYVQEDGSMEIDGNAIKVNPQANNQAEISLDVGAANKIVECEVVSNTTNAGARPYLGVWANITDYTTGYSLVFKSPGWVFRENNNDRASITHTINTTSVYRLKLQVIGTTAAWKVYDVTGATLVGTGFYAGLTAPNSNRAGVSAKQDVSRVDNWKIWT